MYYDRCLNLEKLVQTSKFLKREQAKIIEQIKNNQIVLGCKPPRLFGVYHDW